MGKEKYEFLMGEMDNILETVKKFPESVQQPVFDALHLALMSEDNQGEDSGVSNNGSLPSVEDTSGKTDDENRNYATEIKQYAEKYELSSTKKVNDMEFATFVAYYFIECAPAENKVSAITKKHLEEAITIVRRKMPKDTNSTLSNAAHKRKYLKVLGNGEYSLTANGKHYVITELLISED